MSGLRKTISALPAYVDAIPDDAVVEMEVGGVSVKVKMRDLRGAAVPGGVPDVAPITDDVAELSAQISILQQQFGTVQSIETTALATEAARAAAVVQRGIAESMASASETARNQSQTARDAAQSAQNDATAKANAAAVSATSSAGSASTASAQATIATQSATEAGTQATIANAKADIATSQASQAGIYSSSAATSATSAAGFSSSAASNATLSASARDAARDALFSQYPPSLDPVGRLSYVGIDSQGQVDRGNGWPDPYAYHYAPGGTQVDKYVAHRTPFPKTVNRRYRATTYLYSVLGTLWTQLFWADFANSDATGASDYRGWTSIPSDAVNGAYIPNDTWTKISSEFVVDASHRSFILPRLQVLKTAAADRAVTEFFVTGMKIEDITSEKAAADAANASASSASSAAISSSAAGNSASAANQSRLDAQAANTNSQTAASAASGSAASANAASANAATSSTLAAAYASSAKLSQALTLPERYLTTTDESFTTSGSVDAAPASITPTLSNETTAFGPLYRFSLPSGQSAYFATRGVVPATPGRFYRFTSEYEIVSGANLLAYTQFVNRAQDGSYAALATHTGGYRGLLANGVFTTSVLMSDTTANGATAWASGSAFIHPQVVFYSGSTAMVIRARRLKVEDVTSELASSTSAAASNNSYVLSDAARAASVTASTNSATYRDQSQGYANDALGYRNTAVSQASIATSQAALASSSAAAAQSSFVLTASVGLASMNSNPTFSLWPDGQNFPSYWGAWVGTAARVSGLAGGYAVRQGAPASTSDVGIAAYGATGATGLSGGSGYYVLEANLKFVDGATLNGAGVLVQAFDSANNFTGEYRTIHFATDKDNSGVIPAPLVGKVYRFRKLVRFSNSTCDHFTLYAMTNWYNGFTAGGSSKTLDWYQCSMRAATDEEIRSNTVIPDLQATTTTNAGAIATLSGAAAFYETIVEASGSNPAVVRLRAGVGGSRIDLISKRLVIGDFDNTGTIREIASFTDGVAKINEALIRNLQVLPRDTATVYFPVQLKPKIFLAADGDTVNFGGTLGALPDRISVDISGLPLASGEAFDVKATSVTATGFVARCKRVTPSSPAGQSTGGGTNVGGTPPWQVNKPTVADAYNGYYQFTFSCDLARTNYEPGTAADYEGVISLYINSGSGWQVIDTFPVFKTVNGSGSFPLTASFSFTHSSSWANTIGQHGGYEFGVGAGDSTTVISGFGGVTYTTQVNGSAAAIVGAIPFMVYP